MKTRVSKPPAVQAKKNGAFFGKEGKGAFFGAAAGKGSKGGFFGGAAAGGGAVQCKLTVGQPNDIYEKEADATADHIVRRLAQPAKEKCLSTQDGETVQKKCEQGNCECEDCKAERLSRKPIFESEADPKEGPVQRKEAGSGAPAVTPSVESGIRSTKGSGSPLPAATRQQMETGFGADLSGVRIHNDTAAGKMSGDLNAQAFTHGKDIYFNSGKYDPNSTTGQHLLAHELTHVVQQNKGLSRKADISRKEIDVNAAIGSLEPGPAVIQRAPVVQMAGACAGWSGGGASGGSASAGGSPGGSGSGAGGAGGGTTGGSGGTHICAMTAADLAKLATTEGEIKKNGDEVEIHFKDLPFKQYAELLKTPPPYQKPKGERDTKQGKIWKDEALKHVVNTLNARITAKGIGGPSYQLTVRKSSHLSVTGTVDEIAKQVVVPFWRKDGGKNKHEIEHKVDWQVAGGNSDVDVIDNLLLLDAKENHRIGLEVLGNMTRFYNAIITHYQNNGVIGLLPTLDGAKDKYLVFTDKIDHKTLTVTGSMITLDQIKNPGPDNPFSEEQTDLTSESLLPDKCALHTARSGAGNITPYVTDNEYLSMHGVQKDHKLDLVTLKDVIKDPNKILQAGTSDKKMIPEKWKGQQDHFRLKTEGYAGVLKDSIRGLRKLSPIKWDEDIDFDPVTGWHASGKVITEIPFLEGVDISFQLEGSVFSVEATVTSDVLKDKLPKPFNIDYSSLTISASSDGDLAIGGAVGFSIDKVGSGQVSGSVNKEGFALHGDFAFKNQRFTGGLKVDYSNKEGKGDWSIGGNLIIPEKSGIKGIDHGKIDLTYQKNMFIGDGNVSFTVPGFDEATLHAEIGQGGFAVNGKVLFKSMPGIKPGASVQASVSKAANSDDYSFSVTGEVEPNLPKIPKLNAKFKVSYIDGLFQVEGKSDFGKSGGMITGDVTVGVTNGNVVDGELQKGEGGKNLGFYGAGTFGFHPLAGVDAELHVKINTKGEALFSASIGVSVTPFKEIDKTITFFKISEDFPLFGVPFLSINAHVGFDASLYVKWTPLTIGVTGEIADTTYDDLIQGKFKSDFVLSVETHGAVGVSIGVEVGASVTVAVFIGGVKIKGNVSLEADASVKGTLDAVWEGEKGLRLKGGMGKADASLNLILGLEGGAFVDLNLILTRTNLWEKKWELAKSQPKELTKLGIEAPFEFDANNQLKDIDPAKIKFTPALDKKTARGQADGAVGRKDGNKGDEDSGKHQDDNTVQNSLREQIAENLRKHSQGQSIDMYAYASNLRARMIKSNDPKLTNFVLQATEEEMGKIETEQFWSFKNDVLNSTDTTKVKLKRIDQFQREHLMVDQTLLSTLRDEVNAQAAAASSSSSDAPVSRKPMDADIIQTKPGNSHQPPRAPSDPDIEVTIDMKLPDDPEPNFSKSMKTIGTLDNADIFFMVSSPISIGHVNIHGTKSSFFKTIRWQLDNPMFIYEIASEVLRGTKGKLEPGEFLNMQDPQTVTSIHFFNVLLNRIRAHAKEHFNRYRQVAKEQENIIKEKLLSLPGKHTPKPIDEEGLEEYFKQFILYLNDLLHYEFWDASCKLEKHDYPTLLNGIASGEIKPDCDKKRPPEAREPILVTGKDKAAPAKHEDIKVRREPSDEQQPAPPPPPPGKYRIVMQYGAETIELSEDPAHVRYEVEKKVATNGRGILKDLSLAMELAVTTAGVRITDQGPYKTYEQETLTEHQAFQIEKLHDIGAVLDHVISDLNAEYDNFIDNFFKLQRSSALQILKVSKERSNAEMIRYGLVSGLHGSEWLYTANEELPAFKGMQLGARILSDKRQPVDQKEGELHDKKIESAEKIWEIQSDFGSQAIGLALHPDEFQAEYLKMQAMLKAVIMEYQQLNTELTALKEAYNTTLSFLSGQYPILGYFGDLDNDGGDLRMVAGADDPYYIIPTIMGQRVAYQLQNISKCENAVENDKLNFWRLPHVVQFTLFQMGADKDPVKKRLIEDKVKDEQPGWFEAAALVIMDVVAGLLAVPTAGISVAVAAGVNVAVVMRDVNEYFLQQAAANTDFDKAHSLSEDDPSFIWLALELVSLIPAAGELVKAFKGMRMAIRAARLARTAEELLEAEQIIRAIGKEHQLDEKVVEDIIQTAEHEEAALQKVGLAEKDIEEMKNLRDIEEHPTLVDDPPGMPENTSKKIKRSLQGDLYGCSSPCVMLREKYAKQMANDPELLKEFETLENDSKKAITQEQRDAIEARAGEWEKKAMNVQLASWTSPLSGRPEFEDLVRQRGSRAPELTAKPEGWTGKMEARFKYGPVIDENAEAGYYWRLTEDGKLQYVSTDVELYPQKYFDPEAGEFKFIPPKASKYPIEATPDLEKMATAGKGATNMRQWGGMLRRKIPHLQGVSDEGILRVLEKGPNIDNMKGQLLEEIAGSSIRKSKLARGAEYIAGNRITDAAGQQLTDGMLVRWTGKDELEIKAFAEAKAGEASSKGLNRSYTSIKDMSSREWSALQDDAIEEFRVRNDLPPMAKADPTFQMPEWAEKDAILKDHKEEIDAIMHELNSSDMGQIEKSFERLMPNADEEFVTIKIDGKEYRAKVSVKRTRVMTITPSDVAFEASEDLMDRGISINPIDVGLTSQELIDMTRQLRAEKIINGSKFLNI